MDDMDAMQLFRAQCNPQSEAEAKWLEGLFHFVREYVWPINSGPAPCSQTADEGVSHLSATVLKRIRGKMSSTHTLPISYRLVCVSELLSHQRLACVSNLSWSTSQERALAEEAAVALPGRRALPRAHLLLIGHLTHGRDGEWTLTDASGNVGCKVVSPSPLWMGRLVFLPHWHYIPHDAHLQAQPEARGYVELIGSPVLLCPGPAQGLAAGAVAVKEAAALMHDRVQGLRLSIYGKVASVCPLLVISGTSFFFFMLSDETHTLPVLVKNSSRLWWAQCVSVGECVCVTALRVCVLRPWGGKNILCATEHSEMHKTQRCAPGEDAPSTMPLLPPSPSSEMLQPEECEVQSNDRTKQSKIISYQGTVTEVVSTGAGLYVMDSKLGLCLAYQPKLKRKLRAGDVLAIHHVHFLYRPCPDFPPSILCTCLRSTVTVAKFSAVLGSDPDRNCPDDGVLRRLLVERNLDVSRYMWTCHLCSQFQRSLLPNASQQCTCVLSWKVMEVAFGQGHRHRRDIYAEMLDEPHTCPLTQYDGDLVQHQYVSLSELQESLQEDCWASLCLRSLLPPAGVGLTRPQMDAALAWSCRTLTSDSRRKLQPEETLRQRPLLLVGVLELPSSASQHTLQLRDRTGTIACVITQTTEKAAGGHGTSFNTAWIGCLICVQQFTMVTERFIQSNFPSYQHLDQHKYITYKQCSVYLQFSEDSIHILSPSAAMEMHLRNKGEDSGEEEEEKEDVARKQSQKDKDEDTKSSRPSSSCVSVVLQVEQKNGVIWRENEQASFSVTATVIGPVAAWGQDPKNRPMKAFETGNEKKVTLAKPLGFTQSALCACVQVTVLCSGASARWFPLLQPGRFYRLVATGTHDVAVLAGNATLLVQSGWKFHTLTRPLLVPVCQRSVCPATSTVSQVLDGCADVVSFQGFVSDRINLNDSTRDTGQSNVGARLTVCDQSGRSIHVFLNLNHNAYPLGMLPGNTLLLSAFRRRVSRSGHVYCSNIPVSWVAVLRVRDERWEGEDRPPPPIMHLALWTQQSRTVGRVKGHVVCFLFMQLQWNCFECGSVYKQSGCSGQCPSPSAVFDCTAKLVMEDGTGEAHVHFTGALVRQVLGLNHPQWEGLQRAVKARGHIQVYPRGRSQACDDGLLDFLLLCAAAVKSLFLTCRIENQAKEEVKSLRSTKSNFLTKMAPPLKLTCLQIH
ncbi:CST complex subunit CTC1 isoform X2 [Syngnathus scovelli]|uniref:CST complex subunit CTC1 isoform X2 n=1 Tax=Syngnathus scovelli TaxID=161590 RepID=UPI00211070DC|nr:CST complex subunit CTC1 isoform X2 [Syngnathus scovelli]